MSDRMSLPGIVGGLMVAENRRHCKRDREELTPEELEAKTAPWLKSRASVRDGES